MTDYLVVLHIVTTGKPGEELGVDETPICLLTFLVHDVVHNKVMAVQQHYVKPLANPGQADAMEMENGRASLSDECRLETGLSDEHFDNAHSLEHVIEEFDRFLRVKGIHPESGGRTFTLITDGQVPLRLILHPEATQKKIDLRPYKFLWRFFDLHKVFSVFYKNAEKAGRIADMLDYLDIKTDESVEYGVRKAMDMSRLISRLINDGYQWSDLDVVNEFYYPAIVKKTDLVDDETVVRARGLPWQATDSDIHKFFRGLNIEKGGIGLVLSKVGRRNGEALIRLVDKETRDLALKKHRHHMNQRYIEVYRATGRDFVNVAGGETKEAENFLVKLTDSQQTLLRMRGLPYTVTAEQIIEFFNNANCPVQFDEEGILFVNHKDGRATGDAFVIFDSEEGAECALSNHRQHIGNRYIELFKSTPAEVNQVLNSFLNPAPTPEPFDNSHQTLLTFGPLGLLHGSLAGIPGSMMPAIHGQALTAKVFVRIRGMPVDATVADILAFLDNHSHNIVFQGVHMVYNALGQPAGEAIIQMTSEATAMYAAEGRHKKFFYLSNGKRSQVDVMQCTSAEVNQLTGMPLPHVSPQVTIPTASLLQRPILSPAAGGLPPTALYPFSNGVQGACTIASTLMPNCAPHHTALSFPSTNLMTTNALNQLSAAAMNGRAPTPYHSLQLYNAYQNVTANAIQSWPYSTPSMCPTPTQLSPQQAAAAIATAMSPHSQAALVAVAAQQAAMVQAAHQSAVALQHANAAGYYMTAAVQPSFINTVIAKGLPKDVDFHEILNFFEQITSSNSNMIPDVKIAIGSDGMPSGEAFVSFHTRQEAERALTECNRSLLRNHCVELMLAQPSLISAM